MPGKKWRVAPNFPGVIEEPIEPGVSLFIALVSRSQGPEVQKERAEFIVRACNAHDALVKALEEARRWMIGWESGTPDSRGAVCETAYDAHAMVQAALKLAKEGE